jgi:hypothetical protein
VLLAACSSPGTGDTLLPPAPAAIPDVATTTTEPAPAVEACEPAPFVPTVLPGRVAAGAPAATRDIPYDLYTIISGTSTSVWSRQDGAPVLAVIRGSLPPVRWLETPEVMTVRNVDAALGPLPDGVWGVAWFEGPDRCDEYSIILYPPATAEEARQVAVSLVEGERSP